MEVKGLGSYVQTTNFQSGQFKAGVTGVYYLSANIIFQDPNGPISIIISLNGDNSRRRSLYATKGNPASIKDSLSVAGSLFIRKGRWIRGRVVKAFNFKKLYGFLNIYP